MTQSQLPQLPKLPQLSRRGLFKGAAIAAVSSAALTSLTACGSGGDSAGGGGAPGTGKSAPMPTYVRPNAPKPTYPGTASGVMDVYASFPLNGKRSVHTEVGDGKDFEFLAMTYGQPAPPVSGNAYWQLLNKEMNLNIKGTLIPSGDFQTKFPALVAGNDLPEVVSVPMYVQLSRLPQLVESEFTDLSEHLSGDAVKKYPNLAGIQESGWANAYFDGRIYGVPRSDPIFQTLIYTKTDVIARKGGDPQPKNLAEFTALAKAVTDHRSGVYAFGGTDSGVALGNTMMMMFGVPNQWTKKSDGSFVSFYEHEQFIPSIDAIGKLFKAGYFHPDAPTMSKTQHDALFRAGKLVLMEEGNRAYGIVAEDHALKFGMMVPFEKDGGKPLYWENSGAYAVTMIKKDAPKARVERFLRAMDYLSAPFGSQESLVINYGQKGPDYTIQSGTPVVTTRGQREMDLSIQFTVGGPQVLCYPQGAPGGDKLNWDWQTKVAPMFLKNPAVHLYSPTHDTKGASLTQHMQDAMKAVAFGRAHASSLKDAVRTWKQGGGDQMAREYAESAKKS
jgi:putative aldouronate transport system substrate-binding protein